MTEPEQPEMTAAEEYASYFDKPASAPLSDAEEQEFRLYFPDPQPR